MRSPSQRPLGAYEHSVSTLVASKLLTQPTQPMSPELTMPRTPAVLSRSSNNVAGPVHSPLGRRVAQDQLESAPAPAPYSNSTPALARQAHHASTFRRSKVVLLPALAVVLVSAARGLTLCRALLAPAMLRANGRVRPIGHRPEHEPAAAAADDTGFARFLRETMVWRRVDFVLMGVTTMTLKKRKTGPGTGVAAPAAGASSPHPQITPAPMNSAPENPSAGASYLHLDPERIAQTAAAVSAQLLAMFPDSGIGRVSRELAALAADTAGRVDAITRPHWPVRITAWLLSALVLGLSVVAPVYIQLLIQVRKIGRAHV
jgi:hypothetical protein